MLTYTKHPYISRPYVYHIHLRGNRKLLREFHILKRRKTSARPSPVRALNNLDESIDLLITYDAYCLLEIVTALVG